jgi:hypothetical protein
MSIVVCYVHDEAFSLIATDTRITYGHQGSGIYDDIAEKIYHNGMGWVCGAGLGQLITSFRDRIDKIEVKDSLALKDCFYKAYEDALKEFTDTYTIEMTKVVFSYVTSIEQQIKFRIGMLGKEYLEIADHIQYLRNGELLIIWPFGMEESRMASIYERYEKALEKASDLNDVICSISLLIKEVSALSNSVSDICDIGILALDEQGLLTIQVREQADKIYNAYNEGSLYKYFQLRR